MNDAGTLSAKRNPRQAETCRGPILASLLAGLVLGHALLLAGRRRDLADRDLVAVGLHRLVANALDLVQIIRGLERPIRLAVLNDRLRLGRSNSVQGLQGYGIGGIDIHRSRHCGICEA